MLEVDKDSIAFPWQHFPGSIMALPPELVVYIMEGKRRSRACSLVYSLIIGLSLFAFGIFPIQAKASCSGDTEDTQSLPNLIRLIGRALNFLQGKCCIFSVYILLQPSLKRLSFTALKLLVGLEWDRSRIPSCPLLVLLNRLGSTPTHFPAEWLLGGPCWERATLALEQQFLSPGPACCPVEAAGLGVLVWLLRQILLLHSRPAHPGKSFPELSRKAHKVVAYENHANPTHVHPATCLCVSERVHLLAEVVKGRFFLTECKMRKCCVAWNLRLCTGKSVVRIAHQSGWGC